MTAREVALTVLFKTESNAGYLNLVFKEALREHSLSVRDTAFVKELVFGVYRNKILLDTVIRRNSKLRLKKIDARVLNLLRMGVYQIYFMDKVPSHAAVSETVTLVKRVAGGKTPGFANAVLRAVLREKEKNGQIDLSLYKNDFVKYLSICYSYPQALTEFFVKTFGEKRAESLLKSGNATPPLCIRVNTLKTTKEELKDAFLAQGAEVSDAPYVDCGLYVSGAPESMRKALADRFTVQDMSAQLAALALAPSPNDAVLDLCAAPGGKTTHLAELMENKGTIYACDLYQKRLEQVDAAAKRLGISIIKTERRDATVFDKTLVASFDKILLDVPCSGLGIIRKKPDIRYKDPRALAALPAIQRAILENASRYVKEGGVLLYATCTVLPEENGGVVDDFLRCHDRFRKEAFSVAGEDTDGTLTFWPQRHDTDGFYLCKMRKL